MGNFLESLGMGGGIDVYITVSPACGVEMTTVDPHGNVKSYAQAPLDYNEAQREIANYNDFKNAVDELFKARNINPQKANVHLSLPTVWFGLKEGLPLLLDDTAITNVVIGELEQTYVFKRKEPIPYWFDALASTNSDSRSVFYTAIQSDIVEQIRGILSELGATLETVECSLFADLRGLFVTGIAAEQMNDDGNSWTLMIINNSGFQMIGMQGKRILEYYEEPLPIKSYEGEEIYAAIENAAQIALMSSPSSSLIIVSETDLVSAEIMSKRLQFAGTMIAVEDNQFRKEPLMEMSLNIIPEDQLKVSLHTIGALSPANILPVMVDFLSAAGKKVSRSDVLEIPIGNGQFIKLTPAKATIITGLILLVVLAPLGGAYGITSRLCTQKQDECNKIDAQITSVDEQLKQYTQTDGKPAFDPINEIEKVLKNNRTKIMAYAALGESVPKNLYLTYFMTGDDGFIDIKGCANSVEDVYVFFKNLKDSLVESKLRLSKLDLKSGSLDTVVNSTVSTIDTAPYVFEITNMDDAQLQSFMDKLMGKTAVSANGGKDANGNPIPANGTDNSSAGTTPEQANTPSPINGAPVGGVPQSSAPSTGVPTSTPPTN